MNAKSGLAPFLGNLARWSSCGAALLATMALPDAIAQVKWAQPAQRGHKVLGIANLTNDYTVRDWANYHNTEAWSPNGRWICYTRYASDGKRYGARPATEVHLFDLHAGKDQLVAKGHSPRWANHRNWLFYLHEYAERGRPAEVWWLEVDTGRKVMMGTGINSIGETSHDDAWIFGSARGGEGPGRSYRMAIRENSVAEYLPGLDGGGQWMPNPRHNVVFTRVPNVPRQDNAVQREGEYAFSATRYWTDIDGGNIRIGSEVLNQSHQSWLGNGEYYLMGNSQVRGRKWNEPFPSSIHFLANVSTGDVSPAGRSGRFVVGDKPLTVADLRSGDGWELMDELSILCFTEDVWDNSTAYDADIKGSPDGTKISFVSTYDLINGLVTFVTEAAGDGSDQIHVQSTQGFPASGELVIGREVIGYARTTPTSFEGLTRKKYRTMNRGIGVGADVTPLSARLIAEEEFKKLPLPDDNLVESVGGMSSPLVRQKSSDVYTVVIRTPDAPFLRRGNAGVELIPGEEHAETSGYHLLHDGRRIGTGPLRAGQSIELAAGTYRAVAVEWCGLESGASAELKITAPARLTVQHERPADFSWTYEKWRVSGTEVERARGLSARDATREIVHRTDGVIAREWYNWGVIQQRHDLNAAGKATRRLAFHRGSLFQREYHTAQGAQVSAECLDRDGFVTEMIRYRTVDGRPVENDHWWYDRGMPERRITSTPGRDDRAVMYVRAGSNWVKADYVGQKIPYQDAIGPQQKWHREAGN